MAIYSQGYTEVTETERLLKVPHVKCERLLGLCPVGQSESRSFVCDDEGLNKTPFKIYSTQINHSLSANAKRRLPEFRKETCNDHRNNKKLEWGGQKWV